MNSIQILFLDVGGVLLTNGWDHTMREKASEHFGFDYEVFDRLHKKYYNLHEKDEISLDEYLNRVLFFEKKDFTIKEFKEFMRQQSQPHQGMIDFIQELKSEYPLKIAMTSNEGRELIEYRIKTFNLQEFVDFFFVSCFLHVQKPDPRFFQYAFDITHTAPEHVLYIDDRKHLVESAEKLGLRGIAHISLEDTKEKVLAKLSVKAW